MDSGSYRSRVIGIFEQHREKPGAPYDENRFLDYLLANPKKRRAAHDSFRGLRRYNAFIEDVQYEFAICFSMKDFDANYALDRFVERVLELERSRRGSLASLRNQVRAGPGWHVMVVGNLALLLLAASLRNSFWLLAALVGVAAILNSCFLRVAWKARSYLSRLRARIETAATK